MKTVKVASGVLSGGFNRMDLIVEDTETNERSRYSVQTKPGTQSKADWYVYEWRGDVLDTEDPETFVGELWTSYHAVFGLCFGYTVGTNLLTQDAGASDTFKGAILGMLG